MTEISERLAALSPAKRALLEKRLLRRSGRDGGGEEGAPDLIVPRRIDEGPAPLSFAQQRLWFLDQMAFTATPTTCRPPATVRPARRRGPCGRAGTDRPPPPVLRRCSSSADGEPVQIVHVRGRSLPVVDLRDGERRRARPRSALAARRRATLDLSREWPLRARLLRLAGQEHVLLSRSITSPGTAGRWRARARAVRAVRRGRPAAVPPTARAPSYADFAVWQRRRCAATARGRARILEGAAARLEPLRLPTDRPAPAGENSAAPPTGSRSEPRSRRLWRRWGASSTPRSS